MADSLFDISDEGMEETDRLVRFLAPYLKDGEDPGLVVGQMLMEFRIVPKSSMSLSREEEPSIGSIVQASNGFLLVRTSSGEWMREGMPGGFTYGKTWQELWDAIGPMTIVSDD